MCHHELCPTQWVILYSFPVQKQLLGYIKNYLWLLSEEDFSWNCITGTLSFDGRYNSCKTGYQSISSTDTLSWKKFSLTYLELQGPTTRVGVNSAVGVGVGFNSNSNSGVGVGIGVETSGDGVGVGVDIQETYRSWSWNSRSWSWSWSWYSGDWPELELELELELKLPELELELELKLSGVGVRIGVEILSSFFIYTYIQVLFETLFELWNCTHHIMPINKIVCLTGFLEFWSKRIMISLILFKQYKVRSFVHLDHRGIVLRSHRETERLCMS